MHLKERQKIDASLQNAFDLPIAYCYAGNIIVKLAPSSNAPVA
jgi:hypothetical protein